MAKGGNLGDLGKKEINQIRRFSHQTRRLAEKKWEKWLKSAQKCAKVCKNCKKLRKMRTFCTTFLHPPACLVLCGQFVSRISYLARGLLRVPVKFVGKNSPPIDAFLVN